MRMPVNRRMCATCPWRSGSPYAHLREQLQDSALREGSRICHSTGSNAINERTGKPSAICRGARQEQLKFFHRMGFISKPTDAAWVAKAKQLGIKPDEHLRRR